jgi:two-component system, cell cycle response regulator
VGALACMPASRSMSLEGLLYVDRAHEEAFSDTDRKVLGTAIDFILRATENERAFSRLEKQAREQAKLYRALEALGAARSEAEVIELGVESARDVAAFDFAAVTLFHKKSGLHEICAVSGGSLEHLVGSTFRQNAGLVSMVVANRHPLPYRGEYDAERQVLFSRGQEPPGLPSLLVLPLLVHERALGTLVLGSKQKGAFSEEVRPTLEVLARHMAVSLANATMVSRLEEQATTDGLTGLLNKRALIRAGERRIKAAARFGKPLSVLVTDIDFFKKVNDTYGHDVGDVVIRGLGEVIRRAQRDTDIAGRFGGEEFVIVCEQTDEEGAKNLAERVRRELEGTTFQTELGPLSVTCSVGVATFPSSGKDWESLFKATDEALYASKRGGRNRVTVWRPRLKSSHAEHPTEPRSAKPTGTV